MFFNLSPVLLLLLEKTCREIQRVEAAQTLSSGIRDER